MLNVTIAGNIDIIKAKKMKAVVETKGQYAISNYRDIENGYYSINLGDEDLLTQSGCYKKAQITLQFFDKKNRKLSSVNFAITNKKSIIMANIELKGL